MRNANITLTFSCRNHFDKPGKYFMRLARSTVRKIIQKCITESEIDTGHATIFANIHRRTILLYF